MKVFAVPELLEAIIGVVPDRHILTRIQRVCRSWKATVDASPIQKKLWVRKGKDAVAASLISTHRYSPERFFAIPIYNMSNRHKQSSQERVQLVPRLLRVFSLDSSRFWVRPSIH